MCASEGDRAARKILCGQCFWVWVVVSQMTGSLHHYGGDMDMSKHDPGRYTDLNEGGEMQELDESEGRQTPQIDLRERM